MLKFLDKGTKISVYQNRICFNAPTYVQGVVRFFYGDGREDLHNIFQPIQKCVEWYWNDKNDDIMYMFNNAVNGLKILKSSYSSYATIQHTIDYYIIILMQKNNDLISKLGINILDINKITDVVCNKNCDTKIYESKSGESKTVKNISGDRQDKQDKQDKLKKIDKQNERHSDKNNDKNNDKQTSEENIETHNKDICSFEDDAAISKDIHKFLFELWNEREIKIVINLFKELEAKQYTHENEYIYNNLMKYCEMKENNLFKYIEEHSSIL
jgi:hypothetical protein